MKTHINGLIFTLLLYLLVMSYLLVFGFILFQTLYWLVTGRNLFKDLLNNDFGYQSASEEKLP